MWRPRRSAVLKGVVGDFEDIGGDSLYNLRVVCVLYLSML